MVTSTNIYPSFGVDKLRGQIGQRWNELVAHVSELPVTDPSAMALSLTVRRIQKRFSPNPDARTSRDPLCPVCAADIVVSFPGSEPELIDMFYLHLEEINTTLKSMVKQPRRAALRSNAA